ncbi:MAG: chloride channel protein [Anaerolineae bacterium]|nr:chloride channel protein [Anaerolineae bacterium]
MSVVSTSEEQQLSSNRQHGKRYTPFDRWLPDAQALGQRLAGWLGAASTPEWAMVTGTAIVVGLGAGLGAALFRWLIGTAQHVAFDGGAQVFGFLGGYFFLFIPALGGVIVGCLVYFFAREAKGHGVPEVMEAVALKGGLIRPRVAVVKSLASSVCIGSGGSVGREGPIVQIGSALGSTIGQALHLSPERIRSLVACGAAGGISATFNAPIAGSLFALEVILGEIKASYFGAVVMSAVIADVVAQAFEGSVRAFPVPSYQMASTWELGLYAGLGILAACVSIIYARLIYRMEDLFDGWKRFPEYLKPAVGGLSLGVIGIVCVNSGYTFSRNERDLPGVYGVGYEMIEPALLGELAVGTALALLALKLVATAFTLGSGGSGGVFAPSLFLGAMVGMAFGHTVHSLFPDATGPAGAYALVGMAAVFAGAAHAPATAVLILFEMTGNYKIILPLMFATVVSVIVSRAIEAESIYTLKLTRRGVKLHRERDIDLLESVTIAEAMTRDVDAVPHTMPLRKLVTEFERTHHHGFPVVNAQGELVGMVTLYDLEQAALAGSLDGKTVADIATASGLAVGYPGETMATALWRMSVGGIGRLPVVARDDDRRLLGMVRRADIIRAYEQAMAHRTESGYHLKELREACEDTVRVLDVDVPFEHTFVGQPVREIARQLPPDCILVSVRRGENVIIPRGDTVIHSGDHIVTLASETCVSEVHKALDPA